MRFDQQKSACSRLVFVGTLVGALSASGSGVFAFGQGQGAQAPSPPVAAPAPATPATGAGQDRQQGTSTLTISSDEAVKMALENNLGVRAEQLAPQIQTYAVAQARAAFGPSIFAQTTSRSSTTPPTDFLSGTAATLTNDSLRTNAGAAAAHSVGRWPLQRRVGRRESHNERCVEPVQSPAGLGAHWRDHAAPAAKLHDRRQPPGTAAVAEPPAGGGPRAQTDADADDARGQERIFRPRERDRRTAGRATVPRSGAGVAAGATFAG